MGAAPENLEAVRAVDSVPAYTTARTDITTRTVPATGDVDAVYPILEVTNALFEKFAKATGRQTLAETEGRCSLVPTGSSLAAVTDRGRIGGTEWPGSSAQRLSRRRCPGSTPWPTARGRASGCRPRPNGRRRQAASWVSFRGATLGTRPGRTALVDNSASTPVKLPQSHPYRAGYGRQCLGMGRRLVCRGLHVAPTTIARPHCGTSRVARGRHGTTALRSVR
jgi:hypothetical protein